MASAPMPDPSQQQGPPQGGGAAGAPGAPTQAPAPPELMMLSQIMQAMQQVASMNPAASAGLAQAKQGINRAMSDIVTSNSNPQTPAQSPPY